MERYLDQRIINTKQDLHEALFEILKTSTKVKILDVCKQANITAMTFYHHYDDKVDLIKDAILEQLSLRFPIPIKLKPHNLKQLIYYVLNFLYEFSQNNKELISGTTLYIQKHGYKNSYLDLLNNILQYHINNELRQICSDLDPISINMWSETLTTGLLNLFFNRTIHNKVINFDIVKNNFNLFINNYLNCN